MPNSPRHESIASPKPVSASPQSVLTGKTILLGVTGSIAAYKAATLARLLIKEGAEVEVILTNRGQAFVGPATFAGLTRHPASSDMFAPNSAGETHVSLTARADLLVIAPATADVIARLAQGRADDLLTATALCARQPVVIAPAMHPAMWSHPATARNVAQLKADGRVTFIGPERGEVASGDEGDGRMSEPEQIVAAVRTALSKPDLLGQHVVVTAGPTVEDIDPVRFLTNRSSGKMGYAIAACALERGAKVTLISGPVALRPPAGVTFIGVRGALEMQAALDDVLGSSLDGADAVVMAAAVADYRLAEVATEKIKRERDEVTLSLVKNPDLIAEIGRRRQKPTPVLIGFAVETAEDTTLVALARDKLKRKQVDVIVANHAKDSLGRDDNRVWIVTPTDAELVNVAPKSVVADAIVDHLVRRLAEVGAC